MNKHLLQLDEDCEIISIEVDDLPVLEHGFTVSFWNTDLSTDRYKITVERLDE